MTSEGISSQQPQRGALPSFEQGTVGDVMSVGVMTASPDSPLRKVAGIMAESRVHSVVITDLEHGSHEQRAWGIVTDADILEAVQRDLDELTARDCAASELITVTPGESLDHAAQLMSEHEATHLLVADPETGRPVGVISSLDIAAVVARGHS
jgi:CBS domain-containing protein